MIKSESIKELAAALCKSQSEMGGASKDSSNPFFKSKYSDLSSVVQAIKEPFADNGLSYSQWPITEDGKAGVETILMHDSGEFMQSTLLLPLTKNDAQGAGSAITYARRYALQSLAGIPSEDDDGNIASKGKPQLTVKQFGNMKDKMVNSIQLGERTNQEIIINLEKAYSIPDKIKGEIMGFVKVAE